MNGGRRAPASFRYPALDILRGVALVSMISAHLASFGSVSLTARILHSGRWIDGAFAFVALSGVVTGLVHRRVVERSGLRASAVKLVRRAGFLYLVHLFLALVSLAAYNADTGSDITDTPRWAQEGGVFPAIGRVLELRLEPNYTHILPMYVAFLLWAVVAVALLRRGAWWVVATISLGVYLFGQEVTGIRFSESGFALADWQLLFTGGLLVGWVWERDTVLLNRRWVQVVVPSCAVFATLMYLCARLVPAGMEERFGWALRKDDGGWLAFMFAGAALVIGYVVIDRARGVPAIASALRPVQVLGTKGLPGYVAMVLTVLVIDYLGAVPRTDATLLVVAAVCGGAEIAAMQLTKKRRHVATATATPFARSAEHQALT